MTLLLSSSFLMLVLAFRYCEYVRFFLLAKSATVSESSLIEMGDRSRCVVDGCIPCVIGGAEGRLSEREWLGVDGELRVDWNDDVDDARRPLWYSLDTQHVNSVRSSHSDAFQTEKWSGFSAITAGGKVWPVLDHGERLWFQLYYELT